MAMRDEDFGTDLNLVVGDDGDWSPPEVVATQPSRDGRSVLAQERARADAAEARAEELRWAEVDSRARAGSLKWQLDRSRSKLKAATEEAKEARRAAKDVPSLRAELARLQPLLLEAGLEPGKLRMIGSPRDTVAASKARKDAVGRAFGQEHRVRVTPEGVRHQKGTINTQRKEITRLNREVIQRGKQILGLNKRLDQEKERSESIRESARELSRESLRLHRETRILRDCGARARSLSEEVRWLRFAVDGAQAQNAALKAKLAKRIAEKNTPSRPIAGVQLRTALRRSRRQKETIKSQSLEIRRLRRAVRASERLKLQVPKLRAARTAVSKSLSDQVAALRRALRRSRRQKATIKSLREDNARLRRGAKTSRNRVETLEGELAKLRATGAVLSRTLYGRKSEKQETPRTGRPRGQQRGAPGHGRTPRPGLEERTEEHNPPADACVCARCGQPYAPNGAEESPLVEIEVKAHKRVVRRPRWRRSCDCASSPREVSAPPVPRLFINSLYGTSFWARFLFEHCACFRPVNRVAAWMSGQGLVVSPGTLANSLKRFVALFEPLADTILTHQNETALRHADETSWRVQELRGEDRSSRAWLWTSLSNDAVYFHIDPSRSAEAAHKLFAGALLCTVIVCDRYSAYKKLARLLGGVVILAFCWSHVRRDFIEGAAGQVELTHWCRGWIGRIAEIYRLNEARLEHYDPGVKRQTPSFDAAQGALKEALDGLFAQAARELAELPDQAREAKALRSLANHREGLSVFVDRPQVPMDNNKAERILRGPAIGRGLSFGSDSEGGARFTAIMYSVVGTLSINGIDVLRWLQAWLTACAENGGRPPDDLSPWLPWSMSEERGREFMAPR